MPLPLGKVDGVAGEGDDERVPRPLAAAAEAIAAVGTPATRGLDHDSAPREPGGGGGAGRRSSGMEVQSRRIAGGSSSTLVPTYR